VSRHPAVGAKHVLGFSLITLMADASRVIELRLRMMALGTATPDEMLLMVTEKIEAMHHAGAIIVGGGNASHVVDNYCKVVAANIKRLSVR
jgi:hypothetical protein